MLTKDQLDILREFYSEMKSDAFDLPPTMNRDTALRYLSNNPYWEYTHVDLRVRLGRVITSKTNWGKNLLVDELKTNVLEWMLLL